MKQSILLTLLCSSLANGQEAAGWNSFGGNPGRNGYIDESAAQASFVPVWDSEPISKPEPSFAYSLSSFSLGQGMLFYFKGEGERFTGLEARSLSSSANIWSVNFPEPLQGGSLSYWKGKLYGFTPGVLWCREAATGALVWEKREQFLRLEQNSLLAASDLGILATGVSFGLDGQSSQDRSIPDEFSGWIHAISGNSVYLASELNFAGLLSPEKGEAWKLDLPGRIAGNPGTVRLAVRGNLAVRTSVDSAMSVVNLEARKIAWVDEKRSTLAAIDDTSVYGRQDRFVYRYRASDGSILDRYQAAEVLLNLDLLVLRDRVIVPSSTRTFVFDRDSYRLLQELPVGGRLGYHDGFLVVVSGYHSSRHVFALSSKPLLRPVEIVEAYHGQPLSYLWPWLSPAPKGIEPKVVLKSPDWLRIDGWDEHGVRFIGVAPSEPQEIERKLELDLAIGGKVHPYSAKLILHESRPMILSQSNSRDIHIGLESQISVCASGAPPLRFTWKKDGKLLEGQTQAKLTIAEPSASDLGVYSVTVSNAFGEVESKPIRLSLLSATVGRAWVSSSIQASGNSLVQAKIGSNPLKEQWAHTSGAVSYEHVSDGTALFRAVQLPGNYEILAVDLQTGRESWKRRLGKLEFGGVKLALNGKDLYALQDSIPRKLMRLDTATGEIKAQIEFPGVPPNQLLATAAGVYWLGLSAATHNQFGEVNPNAEGQLFGFSREDLRPIFPARTLQKSFVHFGGALSTDGDQLYTHSDRRFMAFDPKTGLLQWSTEIFSEPWVGSSYPPSISGDFAVGWFGALYAVDLVKRKLIWRVRGYYPYAPVIRGNEVYASFELGVRVFELNTGRLLRSFPGHVLRGFPPMDIQEQGFFLLEDRVAQMVRLGTDSVLFLRSLADGTIKERVEGQFTVFSGGQIVVQNWQQRKLISYSPFELPQLAGTSQHPLVAGRSFQINFKGERAKVEPVDVPNWARTRITDTDWLELSGTAPSVPGEHLATLRLTSDSGIARNLTVELVVHAPVSPTVSIVSRNAHPYVGQALTLEGKDSGPGPFSYQWHKDGRAIPAATNLNLRISSASLSDSGRYHLQAKNEFGESLSEPLEVKVLQGGRTLGRWVNEFIPGRQPNRFAGGRIGLGPSKFSWNLPRLETPPAIGFGLVFTLIGPQLEARDLATGELSWSHTLRSDQQPISNGRIELGGNFLYVYYTGFGTGHVKALDPLTGTIAWDLIKTNTTFTQGTLDGGVLALVSEGNPSGVLAFDAETGKEILFVKSTPGNGTQVAMSSGRLIIMDCSAITAVEARTGRQLWKTAVVDTTNRPCVFALALDSERLLIERGNGLEAFDVSNGTALWKRDLPPRSICLASGRGFLVDGATNLFEEFNPRDGKPIPREIPLPVLVSDILFVTEDALVVSTASSEVAVVNWMDEVWKFNGTLHAYGGGYLVLTISSTLSEIHSLPAQRIVSSIPRDFFLGATVDLPLEVRSTEGEILTDFQAQMLRGPEWIQLRKMGETLKLQGTPTTLTPDDAKEALLLKVTLPDGEELLRSYSFRVLDGKPTILAASHHLDILPDQPWRLTVWVQGATPMTYELRRGDALINSTTDAMPGIDNPKEEDSGSYTLTARNSQGASIPFPFTIRVTKEAAFWRRPYGYANPGYSRAIPSSLGDSDSRDWHNIWNVTLNAQTEPLLLADGVVLVRDETIKAYSLENGNKLWEKRENFPAPVYDAGKIFLVPVGEVDPKLRAFQMRSGVLKWSTRLEPFMPKEGQSLEWTPMVVNNSVYALFPSRFAKTWMFGFDLSTGNFKESKEGLFESPFHPSSGPYVYGTLAERLSEVNVFTEQKTWTISSDPVWAYCNGILFGNGQARSARTGQTLWTWTGAFLAADGDDAYFYNGELHRRRIWDGKLIKSRPFFWQPPALIAGNSLVMGPYIMNRFTLEDEAALPFSGTAIFGEDTLVAVESGVSYRLRAYSKSPKTNRPPVFNTKPILTAQPGQPYQYEILVNDDSGKVKLASNLPPHESWLKMESTVSGFRLVGQAPTFAQELDVVLTATDELGAESIQAFRVSVDSNAPIPNLLSIQPIEPVEEDASAVYIWVERLFGSPFGGISDATLSVASIVPPGSATASIEGNWSIVATPAPNYHGEITVVVRGTSPKAMSLN